MNYLNKRVKAFAYAFKGAYLFFKEEQHAKIHLIIFLLVLLFGFYFDINKVEWLMILLVSGLVFSLEMINSSLEKMMDRIHPEQDEAIGKAKDMAAGAVLVAAVISIFVGVIVFLPYFLGQ